jgi:hypothetical protein
VEAPPYTTPTTGNTFFLNTTASTFLEAELGCTTNGGHLAWYLTAAEQYDVEQFYIRGGYLLPKFHEFYWIGFATLRGQHPEFSWTDGNAKTKYRRCGWPPACCWPAAGPAPTNSTFGSGLLAASNPSPKASALT